MNIKNGRELSYIIGLLQFDGSHTEQDRNRGKIQLEVSIRDIDILHKIEKQISVYLENIFITKRTRDTNFKEGVTTATLSIYDLDFRTCMKNYISPGLKKNRFNPNIQESWFNSIDYLRGIYDADGSLGITANNKPFLSLCVVSENVKDYILIKMFNILGITKSINRNTRDNVYNIVLYNEDAITFTKYLYKDSSIHIDRKYLKYKEMLTWVRSVPKATKRKSWDIDQDKIVLSTDYTLEEKMELLDRTKSSIKNRLFRLKT